MKKLFILKNHDQLSLDKALKLDADIILMQDAVLFANNGVSTNNKLVEFKVYALKKDVEVRGLGDRLVQGVDLIDYDEMVNLLFSGKNVINL
jgi:sulfur relay protein TusB/DsrH